MSAHLRRERVGDNWVARGRVLLAVNNPTGAPLPQTQLSYSAVTGTTVTLTWALSTSKGVTAQRVYNNKTRIATIADGTTTSYQVQNLTPGQFYTFRVTAEINGVNSTFSVALTVQTTPVPTAGAPDTPTGVTAFASSATTLSVSATAATTGFAATGWRVYSGGTQLGTDVTFPTTSTSITVSESTGYSVTVRGFNASGESPSSAPPINVTTPAKAAAKFAGHIPNRVQVGFAAPDAGGPLPQYDEAYGIIGRTYDQGLAIRRIFVQSNISLSSLNSMLTAVWSKDDRMLPVCSFKHSNFLDFWNGLMDSSIDIIVNRAKSERKANGGKGRPFLCTIYHEPSGDGPTTMTNAEWLGQWSQMHQYCIRYISGYRRTDANSPWVYSAANDVRDILTWCSIMNGNEWGVKQFDDTATKAAHPQVMIDDFRTLGGVLMADFYDPIHKNTTTGGDTNYPANSDRTSIKLQNYIDWHRARNAGMLGAGEWSVATPSEFNKAWGVVKANRDVFALFNYFNSNANSKWEWRLIPKSYAQKGTHTSGTTSGVPGQVDLDQYGPGQITFQGKLFNVEIGGTDDTAANLASFQAMCLDSISAASTSAPSGTT